MHMPGGPAYRDIDLLSSGLDRPVTIDPPVADSCLAEALRATERRDDAVRTVDRVRAVSPRRLLGGASPAPAEPLSVPWGTRAMGLCGTRADRREVLVRPVFRRSRRRDMARTVTGGGTLPHCWSLTEPVCTRRDPACVAHNTHDTRSAPTSAKVFLAEPREPRSYDRRAKPRATDWQ